MIKTDTIKENPAKLIARMLHFHIYFLNTNKKVARR
jgi:hypothetical protein